MNMILIFLLSFELFRIRLAGDPIFLSARLAYPAAS